jgi:hypothetical protein
MFEFPASVIRKIISDELKSKHLELIHPDYAPGLWNRDLLSCMFSDLQAKIKTCDTYDKLNDFLLEYYRMSLNEWIESLDRTLQKG